MKYLTSIFVSFILLLISTNFVSANPTNPQKARYFLYGISGNKNVVAYYPSGIHTIFGEEGDIHEGEDLVMKAGKSGNFHQWFLGVSEKETFHGVHTLFLVKRDENCPGPFEALASPNPGWGDYFPVNRDYCVKNNLFKLGRQN